MSRSVEMLRLPVLYTCVSRNNIVTGTTRWLLVSYIWVFYVQPLEIDYATRPTVILGRSPAKILSSNPTGGMDICLLWVSCFVR